MKTSTVLVARGRAHAVYRSVADVPEALRKELVKSTSGLNSATIVIADRRGRQVLAKAIQNLPRRGAKTARLPAVVLRAAGLLLAVGAGALIWFAFTYRW